MLIKYLRVFLSVYEMNFYSRYPNYFPNSYKILWDTYVVFWFAFCFGLVFLPINKSYNIVYWNVENSHFNSKAVTRKFGGL